MHRTSRWDIEDHTRNGHNRVRVDAAGDRQPFLLNRQWIVERPEIGRTARSETVREFASRIRRDLSGSARDVAAEALPRPTLFAYPFSAVVEPTNDPRLPAITREAVDAIFPMSVVTTWPPRWVVRFPGVQAHLMPRFSIDSKTVPDDLFLDLSGTAPLSPNVLNRPLTQPGRWVGIGSNAAPVTALMANDAVTPPAGRGWRALLYAPAATLHWRDYVAKMRMRAIVPGAAASLLVRGTLQSRVEVAVSQGSVVVTHSGRSGSTLVVRRRIPRRAGHDVAVRVRGDRLSVTVDGHKVVVERIAVMEPNGGVGFATWVGRVSAPRPRVSVLSIAPIDDRQRVQQVGAVLGMALGADRDDLAPPVRRSAV